MLISLRRIALVLLSAALPLLLCACGDDGNSKRGGQDEISLSIALILLFSVVPLMRSLPPGNGPKHS